jgi:putative SOS response-associated peptidase YedK
VCGRYSLTDPNAVPDVLGPVLDDTALPDGLAPRYNIAPTQTLPIVANRTRRVVELARWGLIPSWADDPSIGNRLINARGENLAGKPAFRDAYARRRCLVPADGFYEWQRMGRRKQPHFIHLASRRAFAFAGLWERWRAPATTAPERSRDRTMIGQSPADGRTRGRAPVGGPAGRVDAPPLGGTGGEDPLAAAAPISSSTAARSSRADKTWVISFTIVTCPANPLLARLHDRMPVIVAPEDYERWLTRDPLEPDALADIVAPADPAGWAIDAVGEWVNHADHDGPECIESRPVQGQLL